MSPNIYTNIHITNRDVLSTLILIYQRCSQGLTTIINQHQNLYPGIRY